MAKIGFLGFKIQTWGIKGLKELINISGNLCWKITNQGRCTDAQECLETVSFY